MLTARPQRIEAAVESMRAPKGEVKQEALRIDAQRSRLQAIPVEELAHYRINPRALTILPILACETANPPLQERIIALSIAQADQLSWPILAKLLPWIYHVDEFRKKIHRRARKEAPPPDSPLWLREHWSVALQRESPAAALAEAGLAEQPVLARLLGALQLPAGTPLAEAVLSAVVHSRDDAWLSEQPFTETLRFIEGSGTAPSVRLPLLRRVLSRYATAIRDPADLEGPLLELMLLAGRQLQGWPRAHSGLWRGLPASVLLAGRWCQHREDLIAAFGASDFRVAAWMRWLRHIARVERVGSVVGVVLGTRVFAEPAEAASRTCRVYSPPTWADFVRRQSATEQVLPPPRPEVRLPAVVERRGEIDAFILDRCGLDAS